MPSVVERPHAHRVARHKHLAPLAVPDREREIAIQQIEAALAHLGKELEKTITKRAVNTVR